ncbi:MAG: DUF2800 domain-containing protein [Janthinobacterium lividum]
MTKISQTEHARLLAKYGTSRNGHALFSPSGSAMWLNCAKSLLANALYPDKGSFEAAEGTVAHELAERDLQFLYAEEDDGEFFGYNGLEGALGVSRLVDGHYVAIDGEMVAFVQQYVDWCRDVEGEKFFVEYRVDTSWLFPVGGQGGTADFVAISFQRLVLRDLKYGKGVPVFADGNTQLIIYALGLFRAFDDIYDFQEIVLSICQPRLGTFEEWTITREQLLAWQPIIMAAALAAWDERALATPGKKQCQWCKHFTNCEATSQQVAALADASFGDDKLEILKGLSFRVAPVVEVSDAYLVELMSWRGYVEKAFSAAREEIERRALHRDIEGTSWKQGKSTREWVDPAAAAAMLAENGLDNDTIWSKELLSPPQAEIALRNAFHAKREVDALLTPKVVRKVPGKATLALVTDRRPDIKDIADSSFEDSDEL